MDGFVFSVDNLQHLNKICNRPNYCLVTCCLHRSMVYGYGHQVPAALPRHQCNCNLQAISASIIHNYLWFRSVIWILDFSNQQFLDHWFSLVFENLNNRYIFVFTFQHFASCSAAACLQELVIIAIVSTEIIFG